MNTCLIILAALSLGNLQNHQLRVPAGVDPDQRAALSWTMENAKPNTVQTAYSLTVTKNGKKVFASGKVQSSQSVGVEADFPQEAASTYNWTVKVWDNHGGSASASSKYSTGLRKQDWQAKWITAESNPEALGSVPAYFRGEWNLNEGRKIRRATLFATAHGLYEVSLNGARVGDKYLTPGWTSYNKRLQYQAYDVTKMLRKGANKVSAVVAGGWYGSGMNWDKNKKRYRYGQDQSLLLQMVVEYTDGTTAVLGTDETWETGKGETTFATIYDGQTINRNVAAQFSPVKVSDFPYDVLVSTDNEPIIKHLTMPVKEFIVTPRGEKVLDFGQNLVGWEKVRLHGHQGDTVIIRHAEVLDKDGNFYTTNLRNAKATSTYVLSKAAETPEGELFEPTLTFYGFRYISVEGLRENPKPEDFEAQVVYSGFESIGHFACSDPTINQLQSNIEWGFHGNFVDVPTDCPQRDERLGWTGDTQVFCKTASFLGATGPFYAKWLKDVAADQRADGAIPRVVPDVFPKSNSRIGAMGWADCATIVPWDVFCATGDIRVLRDQYDSMKHWAQYMIDQTDPASGLWNIVEKLHFGDWLSWKKSDDPEGLSAVTSKGLIAQCFYAYSLSLVSNAAECLGLKDDAAYYSALSAKARKAFCDEYVSPRGLVGNDTQTAYVLALQFDMLPENLRPQAVDRLVKNIERYKDHITTGFLGTPYICQVLSENGRSDVAYRLLMQKTCPSWIYPISKGATTIWERWDSIQPDGSIIPGMNSFNHYAYGCIGDWMYSYIAGIRAKEPGYKTIEINPCCGGGLTWAEAGTRTPYGKVFSRWEADENGNIKTLVVDIPANTSASIVLPGKEPISVGSGHWEYNL